MSLQSLKTLSYPLLFRTLSVGLGLLVLFNTGGYWLIYYTFDAYLYYQHKQALAEAGNAETEASYQTLTFTKAYLEDPGPAFEWKEAYEFRYQGRMYDIHKRSVKGDSVSLLVEHDKAEERLHKAFNRQEQPDRPNQKAALLGWVKLIIQQGYTVQQTTASAYPAFHTLMAVYKAQPFQTLNPPVLPPPAG